MEYRWPVLLMVRTDSAGKPSRRPSSMWLLMEKHTLVTSKYKYKCEYEYGCLRADISIMVMGDTNDVK